MANVTVTIGTPVNRFRAHTITINAATSTVHTAAAAVGESAVSGTKNARKYPDSGAVIKDTVSLAAETETRCCSHVASGNAR